MSSYRDLTSREAVLRAIKEFDDLGRERFLKKYGFGKARSFYLIQSGRHYDSKAIVGAAYGYQHGRPLKSSEFSGGASTVLPKLTELGFSVIATKLDDSTASLAEEVPEHLWEGARRSVYINRYERSAEARAACIEAHGASCAACGIDFGEVYGEEFTGYIHVHHRVPLSDVGVEYKVDPKVDLVPVCPNCHAVIHFGGKIRSVEDVSAMLE